jgi:hypothetical protein
MWWLQVKPVCIKFGVSLKYNNATLFLCLDFGDSCTNFLWREELNRLLSGSIVAWIQAY